jgi:hypothetical protein
LKKVKVEQALGKILAHDITEIIPGKKKDVAFKRGKVIEQEDIERLLDLGKRHLYTFEGEVKGIHEDEAGMRIAQSIMDGNMEPLPPKEGKVSMRSTVDGLFYVNDKPLYEINRIKDVLVSTVPNRHPVKAGDIVAAARIIPLYIKEKELKKVERVGEKGVIRISPFKSLNVGLVITGSEVYTGRVADGSSAVEDKIRNYGLNLMGKSIVPDEIPLIVLFYGTPVFPGAMFLVARLRGKYVLGAPACVYHSKYTVLDIVLTRIMAGERMHETDMVKLSYGGLCLHCDVCHYPTCFFGKGP